MSTLTVDNCAGQAASNNWLNIDLDLCCLINLLVILMATHNFCA